MSNEIYSAGLISQSFWFVEIKKVIKLIDSDTPEQEIKKLCVEENYFGVNNTYRAKRIYGYIWNRIKNLDSALINLFVDSDLTTQKIINLISIIKGDRLFFEFLYEVYREKSAIGVLSLNNTDANIFFKNKEIQDNSIAVWTDSTKKKLCATYFNFMTDANLLTVVNKQRLITPPILDISLERYLEANESEAIIKAITGEY